jgi:hypothetical protein
LALPNSDGPVNVNATTLSSPPTAVLAYLSRYTHRVAPHVRSRVAWLAQQ